MTDAQKREAARQFIQKWQGRGKEDEHDHSYWIDLLQDVLGQTHITDRIEFQKKVIGADGNTKRIDAYIPETKVIIEQKSLGIDLDKPQYGHEGMTPYEQAKMYDNALPHSEKAKWIVVSNFEEIRVYDMDERKPTPKVILLDELQEKYKLLDFLVEEEVQKITEELHLSIEAGNYVGGVYDSLLKQYNDPDEKTTHDSLNVLCVRLVFCMYAEDAGLFNDKDTDIFKKYIEQFDPKNLRRALIDLFKVLNTPEDERKDLYLPEDLEAFPYCNGGLFADENIIVPRITDEVKEILIEACLFDWSRISPTIFGAVFESTLNPETRRSGGMHYTSIENIHKVIDPLFLDELKQELEELKAIKVEKTQEKKLNAFQDKLASLTFLDPAAGSGNFLTESYLSLRKIENKVIELLQNAKRKGKSEGEGVVQIEMGDQWLSPIKVSISQFYGIEINDFAATVARTALWIAESQMMKATEDIINMSLDFLPLKTSAHIVEGNALRIDWNDVVPALKLDYIMGNPPFVGYAMQSLEQKKDILNVYVDNKGVQYKGAGKIDYVAAWYFKAAEMIEANRHILASYVSTNSITQGEQVAFVWTPLFKRFGINIVFAHKSFKWMSESLNEAAVWVVVIGIGSKSSQALLFEDGTKRAVDNISPYLLENQNIIVESRKTPLCDVPTMVYGSKPVDGGNLVIKDKEYDDFIRQEPSSKKYIKLFYGADEFINGKKRYCIWLKNVSPAIIKQMPRVLDRVEAVRESRLASKKESTRRWAEQPTLFIEDRQPKGSFIIVPEVSTSERRYIPMGFVNDDVICSNKLQMIPDATMFEFGVLTSNVHMAWTRVVCGRLGMGYDYSSSIVYNNFPWPTPTDTQKNKIEETAQGILEARELYPDSSLADLYDPLTMPIELKKAHQANDRAVMEAYGLDVKTTSESDCVAHLMRMYQELTKE